MVLAAALSFAPVASAAQNFSLSTNLIGYADMATVNLEGAFAAGRHWTLGLSWKYNPFTFNKKGEPLNNRQQAYYAGVRYWPWHVFSGWWVGAKAGYQEYSRGGWKSPETVEGDRIGGGFSGGYTYMLHKHLNLDMGLGIWGGYDRYKVYTCPKCGLRTGSGERIFILPSELILALTYVF